MALLKEVWVIILLIGLAIILSIVSLCMAPFDWYGRWKHRAR